MSTFVIGDWVMRERRGLPHLVESIVADDVITTCGRRMTDEPTKTGGPLIFAVQRAGFTVWRCAMCVGSKA